MPSKNIYGSVVSAYFRSDIILFDEYSWFTFQLIFRLQIAEFEREPEANVREPIGEEVFVIANRLVPLP